MRMENRQIACYENNPGYRNATRSASIFPELRPYVQQIVSLTLGAEAKILLPSSGCVFVFSRDSNAAFISVKNAVSSRHKHLGDSCFIAPHEQWLKVSASIASEFIFVVFYPGAFHKLFLTSCKTFHNTVVCPTELCAVTFGKMLAEMDASASKEDVIQNFILSRIDSTLVEKKNEAAFDQLIKLIMHADQATPVGQLCDTLSLNQKWLERTFQKYLGLNPKSFLRIKRYILAMNKLAAMDSDMDYTSIAHASGYHDFSHMIKDFKSISGITPAKSHLKFFKDEIVFLEPFWNLLSYTSRTDYNKY